jgi:transcriptional regulator with XRE-family HTH domain
MHFPENLRFLRKKNTLSQQQLADTLEIPRTTLGDYERGHTQPSMEMLLCIADIFHVKIDQLLRQKIRHKDLEVANDDGLRVLAITVNDDNEGNIELVDTTAEAGYLESFQDPEYIRDLPKIRFPNIPEGTYRGFEIRGDSMMPMESGTIVICKYVESLRDVKDHKTYVIVSQRDGLVYKRVQHHKDQQSLLLISDNENYPPYDIPYEEIKEIWAYHAHLSFSDIKQSFQSALEEKIADIQVKVNQLHKKYLK